jgi:uncharacterized protein YndB with AHSA1/START domain
MVGRMSDIETVERVIPAPAEKIFALIADPSRHHEFDGSGTVREAKDAPEQLQLGSRFGMSMKFGVPYSMVNEIIDFEPNRLIAWQTRPPSKLMSKMIGGRIWRYELEPTEGGTLVRESWDISQEAVKAAVKPMRGKTRQAMEATLQRIEEVLADDPS